MQSMKKMGGIKSMLEMLPGMSGKDIDVDENAMKKPEAIIRSMTPKERRNPSVLNAAAASALPPALARPCRSQSADRS